MAWYHRGLLGFIFCVLDCIDSACLFFNLCLYESKAQSSVMVWLGNGLCKSECHHCTTGLGFPWIWRLYRQQVIFTFLTTRATKMVIHHSDLLRVKTQYTSLCYFGQRCARMGVRRICGIGWWLFWQCLVWKLLCQTLERLPSCDRPTFESFPNHSQAKLAHLRVYWRVV